MIPLVIIELHLSFILNLFRPQLVVSVWLVDLAKYKINQRIVSRINQTERETAKLILHVMFWSVFCKKPKVIPEILQIEII